MKVGFFKFERDIPDPKDKTKTCKQMGYVVRGALLALFAVLVHVLIYTLVLCGPIVDEVFNKDGTLIDRGPEVVYEGKDEEKTKKEAIVQFVAKLPEEDRNMFSDEVRVPLLLSHPCLTLLCEVFGHVISYGCFRLCGRILCP